MPDKDDAKYNELENLGENAGTEESSAEATDEADLKADSSSEASQPQEKNLQESDIAEKIAAAAKVRNASDYLRGQKQVKVIKKSAIKTIVDEIIHSYSGIEHKELLSKIAEYEFNISAFKQEKEKLSQQLEELLAERQAFRDELAQKYEKELEELRTNLAAAQKMLSQDVSREKLRQLEEEILRLRRRVDELEQGLEFAAIVEEYDYGSAIESVLEQKEKLSKITETIAKTSQPDTVAAILEKLDKRYDLLINSFKEFQKYYNDLFNKVYGKEGSIEAVTELVRINAKNRGWKKELEVCEQLLQATEPFLTK